VIVESSLIRHEPSWSMSEWSAEAEAVHGISRAELDDAPCALDVAEWFYNTLAGRPMVSDAPEFDARWLRRLAGDQCRSKIYDIDQALRWAFSVDGVINPGRLHKCYKNMTARRTTHRAGPDAANMAYAWRAGIGK
jgi:DNA polymerase-3 subunit epsilon